MKKALCAVLLGLIIIGAAPCIFAQDIEENESEFYYVSVPIEKIYTHRNGYVVAYRKFSNQMAQIYIPMEWFSDPTGKADMVITGSGPLWPQMTLYYKSGEFSHVRLIVRRDRHHATWGVVPLYVDIDDYFQGVEELRLEY